MTTAELEALAEQLLNFIDDGRFTPADHEDARRLRLLVLDAAAGLYF